MNNDEHVFDYMAAAEETGRQLDLLVRQVPDHIKTTLSEEWRKSPWLMTLPAIADKIIKGAERLESASEMLTKKVKVAGTVVCLAVVVIPLLTWGYAYWQTSEQRNERNRYKAESDALHREAKRLEGAVAAMQNEAGGAYLYKADDGTWVFSLPPGTKIHNVGIDPRGRNAVSYISGK